MSNLGLSRLRERGGSVAATSIFGRTCNTCDLNFMTSDPKARTCQWCEKAESLISVDEIHSSRKPIAIRQRGLVREER